MKRRRKDQLPAALGEIFAGNYPPPQKFTLLNIWRALASSSVLADSRGKAKPPSFVDLAKFYDTNFNCDYYWTTNEMRPNKRQLILKTDGHYLENVFVNGQMRPAKLFAPYDKGYTNAIGVWKQATNIAGMLVPTDYSFTSFSPKSGGRTAADLQTASTYRCLVTNIATAPIPLIPVPLPAGNVLVTDRRFDKSENGGTRYSTRKGWFHQEIDPADLIANESVKLKVGDLVPDFIVQTFDGKPLKLSDLRGRYVLLDFRATTCMPCVRETPNMKATFDAFGKNKQFAMVSLSLDVSEKEPRKFVAAKGIAWTQSFLDEQLIRSVQEDYGFSGIPQILLVGPNGKLLAKDLRGAKIQQAVASALGSP